MFKSLKKFGFCLIICVTFFVALIMDVNAEMITEDKNFFTCQYSSPDNKYAADYELYVRADSGQNYNYVKSHHIVITKFNGSSETNSESNYAGSIIMNQTIVTGECPKYMVIFSDNGNAGRNARTFYTKGNAEEYLDGKIKDGGTYLLGGGNKVKGAVLSLDTNYYDMLEGVRNFNHYFTQKYSCSSYGGILGTCSNWVSEPSYVCDYGNGLTLGFKQNFSAAILGLNDVANYPTSDYGKCPNVTYELIKENKKYYKFFGGWPDECTKNENITCYKYVYGGSKTQYVKDPPPPEVYGPIKGVYYKYKDPFTLAWDTENPLVFTISGNTDGDISSMTVKIRNQSVSLAFQNESNFKTYINNFSSTKGQSDLPLSLACGQKDKMIEAGYNLTTAYTGLVDSNTYCTETSIGGYTGEMPTKIDYYFLNNTELDSYLADINSLIANVPDLYKNADCENNPYSTGCLAFQDSLYDTVTKIIKDCKRSYTDLTIPIGDLKACEDFVVEVESWANAGYFGNRIITEKMDNDCSTILGSLGVWLKRIYDIMKYAVPVIIVVFGIKDFISGIISGKDDALKKAGSTFVKRLIWGAVFVAIPVLVTMILTFAFGGGFADICIF